MLFVILQVFTIHAMPLDGIMIPLLYGLLPNKRQETYSAVIDVLRQELGRRNLLLNATRFSCDFEVGLHNAIRDRIPGNTFC